MSAKERKEREATADEQRRQRAERNGMAQLLNDSNGRALVSWLTRTAMEAEGPGSKQLRAFGRDILRAAQLANWQGVQLMRDEWERPRLGARAEAEAAEGDD